MQAPSRSRKTLNVVARDDATLIVDDRRLRAEKWVYAAGGAQILEGERSKTINERISRRYLTDAALADARVGPVFLAACDVTIQISPKTWRGWDSKLVDDQFFGGILAQSHEKWFRPLDG